MTDLPPIPPAPPRAKIWKIILIVWVVFSLCYIASDIWDGFKTGVMEHSYMAGKTDTVRTLLEQSRAAKCQPFNVYLGDDKVDLIDIKCLSGGSNSSQKPSTPPATQPK